MSTTAKCISRPVVRLARELALFASHRATHNGLRYGRGDPQVIQTERISLLIVRHLQRHVLATSRARCVRAHSVAPCNFGRMSLRPSTNSTISASRLSIKVWDASSKAKTTLFIIVAPTVCVSGWRGDIAHTVRSNYCVCRCCNSLGRAYRQSAARCVRKKTVTVRDGFQWIRQSHGAYEPSDSSLPGLRQNRRDAQGSWHYFQLADPLVWKPYSTA